MKKLKVNMGAVAQTGGLCLFVLGVGLVAGFAWAIITAGGLMTALGAAHEAGLI